MAHRGRGRGGSNPNFHPRGGGGGERQQTFGAQRDFRADPNYKHGEFANKLQRPPIQCLYVPDDLMTEEDLRKIKEQADAHAAWRKQEGIEFRFAEEQHLWVQKDQKTESEEAKRKKAEAKAANIARQEARSHPKVQGPSIGRGQMLQQVRQRNNPLDNLGVRQAPAPQPEKKEEEQAWNLENHVPQGAAPRNEMQEPPAAAVGRGRGRGRRQIMN